MNEVMQVGWFGIRVDYFLDLTRTGTTRVNTYDNRVETLSAAAELNAVMFIMIQAKGSRKVAEVAARIKVIKKAEVTAARSRVFIHEPPKKEAARQIAATVLSWVTELEERKIEGIRLATERFQRSITAVAVMGTGRRLAARSKRQVYKIYDNTISKKPIESVVDEITDFEAVTEMGPEAGNCRKQNSSHTR